MRRISVAFVFACAVLVSSGAFACEESFGARFVCDGSVVAGCADGCYLVPPLTLSKFKVYKEKALLFDQARLHLKDLELQRDTFRTASLELKSALEVEREKVVDLSASYEELQQESYDFGDMLLFAGGGVLSGVILAVIAILAL